MSQVPKQEIAVYKNRIAMLDLILDKLGLLDTVLALNPEVSHLATLSGITMCMSTYMYAFCILAVSFIVSFLVES